MTIPDVVSAQGLTECLEDGCHGKLVARGRCRPHYRKWWAATPKPQRMPALNLKTETPEQRFWRQVDRNGPGGCWPWLSGSSLPGSYGKFYISPERGRVSAQSFARELLQGVPCPPGLVACHHC